MKKIVALFVLLALLFAVPALAEVTPGQLVGTWNAESAEDDTVYYLLTNYSIEFKRNKTAVVTINDVPTEYTWDISGENRVVLTDPANSNILTNKVLLDFEEDGGVQKLTGSLSEITKPLNFLNKYPLYNFVFTREATPFQLPQTVAASQEDDFFGVYNAVYQVESSMVGLLPEGAAKIEISFAQVTLTIGDNVLNFLSDLDENGNIIVDAAAMYSQYSSDPHKEDTFVTIELTEQAGMIKLSFANAEGVVGYSVYFAAAE